MDKLSRSIEALKLQSSTTSDGFVVNKEKIDHFNTITESLCSPALSKFDEKNKSLFILIFVRINLFSI